MQFMRWPTQNKMKTVTIAAGAGFCFGVSRALNMVEDGLRDSRRIATLGPIIHNRQVVESLAARGVRTIDHPAEALPGETVVIRSHGVSKAVEEELRARGIPILDATCPFVKKIHTIVQSHFARGIPILIIGDPNHPEVQGINGWCENRAHILETENEALELGNHPLNGCCCVAQTTFNRELWSKITKIIKNTCQTTLLFDTICNATNERQKSTACLAAESDTFIVIGGKHSSNTKKLYDIARARCGQTLWIEGAWELEQPMVGFGESIGITAGASTPEWIIKEVSDMVEEKDTIMKGNGEQSFAEALEESLVALNTGQTVTGIVSKVTPTEVYVDLGFKSEGVIPAEELSDIPNIVPSDVCKVGDEIEVFIVRVNDVEGYVKLSKKKVDAVKNWGKIEEANGTDTVLDGRVIEAVNRGVIVSVSGNRVFVPASMASERFLSDLSELVGQDVKLRIVNIKEDRRGKKAIGSIKSVAMEEKAKKSAEFWESVEKGKAYTGTVKTLTAFGAFVDLGGVDGLVHISELSWKRIKHPSEVVSVGDTVEVTILDANPETGKISLGFKKLEDNPWEVAKTKFNVGDVVSVRIVRLVPFGAFAELIPGIDGLIHISQIADKRIGKPADVLNIGEVVDAKITEIDWEAKKVGLSIRALLEEQKAADEAAPADVAIEDVEVSTEE